MTVSGFLFAFPQCPERGRHRRADLAAEPADESRPRSAGRFHLLLEVDGVGSAAQRREALVDSIRDGLRRGSPRVGYRRLGARGECAGFDLRRDEDHDRAREILNNIEPNSLDPLYEVSMDGLSYTVCNTETGRREI